MLVDLVGEAVRPPIDVLTRKPNSCAIACGLTHISNIANRDEHWRPSSGVLVLVAWAYQGKPETRARLPEMVAMHGDRQGVVHDETCMNCSHICLISMGDSSAMS